MSKKKAKIEFVPIINKCTYHNTDKTGICPNCNNTQKYKDGYYLVIDNRFGFVVDTIK